MPEKIGRYELIADIGKGGMADVKLALQRGPAGFEKLVVLKLVHAELASDKSVVDMLLDEAKLAAMIKHPNVVDVYELGEADGRYFIAMEYLEGEPLLSLLEKGASGKKLDALSMARIIADTAEGLASAHDLKARDGKPLGVVHHDISLGNIFVLYSGLVKLLDFGVAKAARKAKKDDKVFGKLAYMAPEKLDERPGADSPARSDRRSDIWSLGCVLWEALTFKRLFKGQTDIELIREVRYVNVPAPSTVASDVPSELDAIALKALQRDPTKRFATAKEMAIALEDVLTAKAYPSKNYKIATYMMQTFVDHIAARERVLREVSGTDRPSTEAIEAAFERRDSRDSLPALDAILASANQTVLPEGSTGAEVAVATPGTTSAITAAVPVPDAPSTEVMEVAGAPPPKTATVTVPNNPFELEDQGQTVYDVVPANAEASRALRYEADPSWNRGKHGEALEELQRKAQELREHPEVVRRRRRIRIALGAASALLLVMIIVIARSCDEDDAKPTVAAPASDAQASIADAAVVAAVEIDAAEPTPAPEPAIEPEPEIEFEPEPAVQEPKPAETPKPRPKPTKSAAQLYAEGLAAWKKKDTKAAYALFTDGRRADAKYANNWYGLGLVHEKAGRKADARKAYERYLKLAPNAPNGAKLRDHIKRNLL